MSRASFQSISCFVKPMASFLFKKSCSTVPADGKIVAFFVAMELALLVVADVAVPVEAEAAEVAFALFFSLFIFLSVVCENFFNVHKRDEWEIGDDVVMGKSQKVAEQ